MSATALSAQLDAHDALIRACLDGTLPLLEFAAAYGNFPSSGLATGDAGVATAPTLQRRIAFHMQVAGILAGAAGLEGRLAGAVTLRLTHLAARYPNFSCGG